MFYGDPERSVATGSFRAANLDKRLSGRGRLLPDCPPDTEIQQENPRCVGNGRMLTLSCPSRASASGSADFHERYSPPRSPLTA
jgi:hypothetical protein